MSANIMPAAPARSGFVSRLLDRLRPLRRGLNLIGYARGGLGLGENLRRFAEAAQRAGTPFALVDFDRGLGERGRDTRLESWIGTDNPYDTNLWFVNADQMPAAREHFGERFFARRRNVGFWFWELERFPQAWHGALDLVDEVWVASAFVAESIGACTSKPVRVVRLPVEPALEHETEPGLEHETEPAQARIAARREFGLPDDAFVVLFSFDFHSFASRKNPIGAIRAFRQAFPEGDDRARLVIKSINGARAPALRDEVLDAIGADARIGLVDEFMDAARTLALTAASDCYLSLHRSEGFGLGMAEAMALGKPVVATGYSGNLAFMTPENSCLVGYRLVPVGAGEYPWGEGQRWAEPDIDDAARQLRRLVDDPAEAAAIGRRGALAIRERHSARACMDSVASALRGGASTGPRARALD